jgi:hypothetical protein
LSGAHGPEGERPQGRFPLLPRRHHRTAYVVGAAAGVVGLVASMLGRDWWYVPVFLFMIVASSLAARRAGTP